MKTFDGLFDMVIGHEGYYANVAGDKGGETYMGVARNLHPQWPGWLIVDAYKEKVGEIEHNEEIHNSELAQLVKEFYKHTFFDKYRIEGIHNGSLQEIIFDWCVNSDRWGSRGVQRVLNQFFDFDLKMDGIIGNQTLSAINSCDPEPLFDAIKLARVRYYYTIAKKGQNKKFLDGWLERVDFFEFEG